MKDEGSDQMGQFAEDFATDRAAIACRGEANDVWHRLGHFRKNDDTTREEWLRDSDLDWTAVKVPAQYLLTSAQFPQLLAKAGAEGLNPARWMMADDLCFIVRTDNGRLLGRQSVTDMYQPVQPGECYDMMDQFVGVDPRFHHDVMGHYSGGSTIWGSALFRDELAIAGEPHVVRLLFTTSFDGSSATRVQACVTRPVCDNTIRAAIGEARGAVVSVRHSTRFDRQVVARQLAGIVASVDRYKAMGDAMQATVMAQADVSNLFRQLLEIPFDARQADISTRKMNQFRALSLAFSATRRERNASSSTPIDAWTTLQAVTRWVDHDRTSINGDAGEKQFLSANFGSGDGVKQHAMQLLMPLIRDKVAA